MASLLHSLLLDNSSSVCTLGLTLLTKLLPIFAKEAPEVLKSILPSLLSILARVVCWKDRQVEMGLSATAPDDEHSDEVEKHMATPEEKPELLIREDIAWKCLEATAEDSGTPAPNQFFTTLYYLFPCNVIRFLRDPLLYLEQHAVQSPYTVGWEEALDEVQVKSRAEVSHNAKHLTRELANM
jgi:hypothetical protein